MRWKIETFHKILKSGCRAEDSRLHTADRLANLLSIYCILSWRIFWMTMLARTDPAISPHIALTDAEIQVLDRLLPTAHVQVLPRRLSYYMTALAKLGGFGFVDMVLARQVFRQRPADRDTFGALARCRRVRSRLSLIGLQLLEP